MHRGSSQAIVPAEQPIADSYVGSDRWKLALHECRGILALEHGPGSAHPEERLVGVHELMLRQAHDALLGDDVRAHAGARALNA
jgi:hypothetical protein